MVVVNPVCESSAEVVTARDLAHVLPTANVFGRRIQPFPHYVGYAKEAGDLVGAAFLTTEVVPDESWGYRDRIATLVGVDTGGRITGVKVLREFESARYTKEPLSDGSWFLTQFEGKDAADNLVLGDDVDGITGATITSSSIARSINAGLQLVTQEVLELQVRRDNPAKHLFFQHLVWQIDFIFLWIIVGLAAFGLYTKNALLRYCILGLSVAYLGIFKGGGLSVNDVVTLLSLRSPVLLNNLYWYSLVVVAIASAIIAGRFYCGWLCPFGAVLEVLYPVVPIEWTISKSTDRYLRAVKYVILVIILLLALVFANNTPAAYLASIVEPFATLFQLHGDVLAWTWLILALMCASVISRCYCRYFCPLVACFAILSAVSSFLIVRRFSVKLPQDNCIGCRLGERQCQMGAISYDEELKRPRIDGNECVMCNACAVNCPVAS